MQQPTPSMMPGMPSFPPTNITTEQIQKYLDENKKLILAILDNQNLGKLSECAQYQAQLQKNLMYLAAIADAQPQMATVPAQVAPHPAMQQGAYYMQQQAAAMAQQPGVFPPRMPAQFGSPLQMHEQQHQAQQQKQQQQQQQQQLQQQQQQQLQQQQAIAGQMNFRPAGPSDGMHPMQTETSLGGGNIGGPPTSASPSDTRGGNKQDGLEAGSVGDGQGSSAAGARRSDEAEPSNLKASEEGK